MLAADDNGSGAEHVGGEHARRCAQLVCHDQGHVEPARILAEARVDSASCKTLRAGDCAILYEFQLDSLGNFGPDCPR